MTLITRYDSHRMSKPDVEPEVETETELILIPAVSHDSIKGSKVCWLLPSATGFLVSQMCKKRVTINSVL